MWFQLTWNIEFMRITMKNCATPASKEHVILLHNIFTGNLFMKTLRNTSLNAQRVPCLNKEQVHGVDSYPLKMFKRICFRGEKSTSTQLYLGRFETTQ